MIFEFWDLDYFIDAIILDNIAAMEMIGQEAPESATRLSGERNRGGPHASDAAGDITRSEP
jgi:hypothetical protein